MVGPEVPPAAARSWCFPSSEPCPGTPHHLSEAASLGRAHPGEVRSGCVNGVQPSRAMKSHHSPENAARERSRVRNLRQAFHSLQAALPSVPRDTKLSKLDVLVLATDYIAHLTETLDQGGPLSELPLPPRAGGYLHPVKKWPMRSLLYCGSVGGLLSANQTPMSGEKATHPLTPSPEVNMDRSI
uniref:BHLH domain-containing protein n=1 Tax=Oncorhynchus mykiss TaxID=8022 RepID=A0A8C7QTX3_ONCMY